MDTVRGAATVSGDDPGGTQGPGGLITLNRPKALNALNTEVMNEAVDAAGAFDRDPEIGALVVTGSEKAFAAGADIREIQALTFVDACLGDWFAAWDELGRLRKPVIAAVAGYAPGVGTGWCASRSRAVSLTPAYRARPDTGLPVRVRGSSLGEWGVPAVLRGQASRKPARSLASALVGGPGGLLWLHLLGPLAGAALAVPPARGSCAVRPAPW
ncbi:enoyl-CoA hydratase-related protein [Saccharothrix sp. ST-888]|uniref:enoyl-CoA hydratase-related protein n=1 Tax=Saccharothrix sp. ST-888 TaxID=1427391 RepID=UPI0006983CC0|nr:enoyl-CoA hydratase-related protein [Saccharothrix sp. ST-888]